MEREKAKHIGIVACTSEGGALCYRTICLEAATAMGAHFCPEVSLHNHALGDYVARIDAGDWDAVAELMLSSAHKLANVGAQLLICPDNTIQQAFPLVGSRLPLPWLQIAVEVAREASAKGHRKLAILGTRSLMESAMYADALAAAAIGHCTPALEERLELDAIIARELVVGKLTARSRQRVNELIARLVHEEGCDAMVLGCTELPLLIAWDGAPVPVLDSTRLLARAALREALG